MELQQPPPRKDGPRRRSWGGGRSREQMSGGQGGGPNSATERQGHRSFTGGKSRTPFFKGPPLFGENSSLRDTTPQGRHS